MKWELTISKSDLSNIKRYKYKVEDFWKWEFWVIVPLNFTDDFWFYLKEKKEKFQKDYVITGELYIFRSISEARIYGRSEVERLGLLAKKIVFLNEEWECLKI